MKALEHDKVSPTSSQLQEIESKVENTEKPNVKEDKYKSENPKLRQKDAKTLRMNQHIVVVFSQYS